MSIAQGLTTDEIREGLDNQYFTVTRAQDAVASLFATVNNVGVDTSNVVFTYNPTSKTLTANVKINPSGIMSLAEDLTPMLGGDLNLAGYNLFGPGNISGVDLYANHIQGNNLEFKNITSGNIFVSNNIVVTGNISANGNFTALDTIVTNNIVTNNITANIANVTNLGIDINLNNHSLYGLGQILISHNTDLPAQFTGVITNNLNKNEPARLVIRGSRGTISDPTTTLAGDMIAGVRFEGYIESGAYVPSGGIISCWENQANVSTTMPLTPASNLTFFVGSGESVTDSSTLPQFKFCSFNSQGVFRAPILQSNVSEFPTNPKPGMIIFNETDNHFYGWNGKSWRQLDNE